MPKLKCGGSVSQGVQWYGTKSCYTNKELERIQDYIRSGKTSQYVASKNCDIPWNMLRNKLAGYHTKKGGRPTVFLKEEELSFVFSIYCVP